MPGNHLPRTKTGRALLGLDMTPEEGYWESLTLTNERSRAILAIEEEAAALDVDRLDRAMAAAGVHVDPARPGPTRPVGCRSCADGIRRIAREYAALAAARDRVGTEEPGPE